MWKFIASLVLAAASFGLGFYYGQRPVGTLQPTVSDLHHSLKDTSRNILDTTPVMPWEAALGTTVSVPTLGGRVDLRVPEGSDSGRKLRLRGRGLPGKPAAGDQIVELEVSTPKPDNDAQREAYQRLAEAFGDKPR